MRHLLIVGCVLCAAPVQVTIAQAAEAERGGTGFERMTVIGSRTAIQEITGAANYVSIEEIEVFQHTDLQRTLRQVPGVYVVEEGYGLRPNIGLRGSGTDRSARIALMEDDSSENSSRPNTGSRSERSFTPSRAAVSAISRTGRSARPDRKAPPSPAASSPRGTRARSVDVSSSISRRTPPSG